MAWKRRGWAGLAAVVGVSATIEACGSAGSAAGLGTLIVTAPPCPGPAGVYQGRTTLIVSGNGVHWSKVLDGPAVVISSKHEQPSSAYTVVMALPAGRYSLQDVGGVTHAAATVRANGTRTIDLGSSCS